jgi:hypothetical protein
MLLFLDESGTDHKEAPYEVLAGIAVREHDLWNLIQAVRSAERTCFGTLLSDTKVEIKGKKLLKTKVFRLARQTPPIDAEQRMALVRSFLRRGEDEEGGSATREEFTAYGQACLAFVEEVFAVCARFGVRIFAAMVEPNAPQPAGTILRKDYSYLFERFFYYLEDRSAEEMGLLVFDERDRDLCRRLAGQMSEYFVTTYHGLVRSSRIVPEPFFVHSDLTTAVQVADLAAYSLNWGLRLNRMDHPIRGEMQHFGALAFDLRYVGQRPAENASQVRPMYGIFYVDDLRPKAQRTNEKRQRESPLRATV